ncbi:MAG: hypothetical protein ACYDHH_29830 [Solirubrobacteraceae bacterium]
MQPENIDIAIAGQHAAAPADRAILMMGCIGGAITLVSVTLAALITGTTTFWLLLGPIGAVLLSVVAWRAWRLVSLRGYFHQPADEEDEDGNPEGGSGVRFPPDAPDGGGSLEFDWDAFQAGFWQHVEATARETGRELTFS